MAKKDAKEIYEVKYIALISRVCSCFCSLVRVRPFTCLSMAYSCACLFICGIVFKAGAASWGTDEGKFIRIFTLRSRPQLGATFPEYKKVSQSNVIIKQCLSLKVKTSTCYF